MSIVTQKNLIDDNRQLINHRNTISHRFHINSNRSKNKAQKSAQRKTNIKELLCLEGEIAQANTTHKELVTCIHELEATCKAMALPWGSHHDIDNQINSVNSKRAEAYKHLQDLRTQKHDLEASSSTPTTGLRKQLTNGRAIKGKSALADPAYHGLEPRPEDDDAGLVSEDIVDDVLSSDDFIDNAGPSLSVTTALIMTQVATDWEFEVKTWTQITHGETPSHPLWLNPNAASREVVYDPQVAIDVGDADVLDVWMV